jgi:hypothetical protein
VYGSRVWGGMLYLMRRLGCEGSDSVRCRPAKHAAWWCMLVTSLERFTEGAMPSHRVQSARTEAGTMAVPLQLNIWVTA